MDLPLRYADIPRPFLMTIDEVVASAPGPALTCSGTIERGIIQTGDEVLVLGGGRQACEKCTRIELNDEFVNEGGASQNIRITLDSQLADEVRIGQIITMPGSIRPHRVFKAEMTPSANDEELGLKKGCSLRFLARNATVSGLLEVMEPHAPIEPGREVTVVVHLSVPTPLEVEQKVRILHQGLDIGFLIVEELIG